MLDVGDSAIMANVDSFILCNIHRAILFLGLLFAKHKVLIRGGENYRTFPSVEGKFRRCHGQPNLIDVGAAVGHSLVMLLVEYGVYDGCFGAVEIAKDDARRQVLDATCRCLVAFGRCGVGHTPAHVLGFVFKIFLHLRLLLWLHV